MSVIVGVSTTLYEQIGKVCVRFIGVLEEYYPWDLEPKGILQKKDAVNAIYNIFWNPLTHDLGLDVKKKSKGLTVKIEHRKTQTKRGRDRGLTEKQIESLEMSKTRPTMPATVTAKSQKIVLLVEGLYWGVRNMIEGLSVDQKKNAACRGFLGEAMNKKTRHNKAIHAD